MDISKLKCRVPRPGGPFRVNPDPNYRLQATVTFQDGEFYLFAPAFVEEAKAKVPPEKRHEIKDVILFLAQNDKEELFIWPVEMPVPDNHPAFLAMREWMQLETGYSLQ